MQSISTPDRIIKHEPAYCKCCGRPLDGIEYRKIRKTQIIDIKFVVETTEEQYYEKVCQCGCVNNCDAPNCRIKYGDNIRALVSYLNVVQCIPFKRIAELISDLCGRRMSEGTIQNILKGNSAKSDNAYEEIRKRIECAPVVGADETGAAIALPEFLYRQRSLCPQGAADVFLRNRVAIVLRLIGDCLCGVNRLAEGLLAVFALICAIFALKLEKNVGNVRGNVYFCELKFVKRLKKKENL